MKIDKALEKAKKKKALICSKKLRMYGQNTDSLSYWLLSDDCRDINYKQQLLKNILETKDWKLEK